jgi:probable rRNA maturation factor
MIEVEILGRRPAILRKSQVVRAVVSAVAASRRKPEGAIVVVFVSGPTIRKLNREHRGKDQTTDVLSFALVDFRVDHKRTSLRAGDLFIAPSYVKQDALKAGEDFKTQLIRVIVHGTLHLMGLDHAKPAEEKRMFALQERTLKKIL